MITYPLNNIEYTAEDAELYNSTRTSGVYDPDTDFVASCSGTDLQITIGKGLAWIQNSRFKGKVVALKEDETVVLPAPPTGSPRYDVIAIRFSALQNKSEIVVISGDPAIGPVPDIPGRNESETVYELFLYAVRRETNSYVVYEEDIEDLRSNPNYCGIMADPVSAALPLIGGRMKGSIDMDYSVISNVGDPTSDGDAANKRYVDSKAIPAVSYPVERGQKNGWRYIKWASGEAVCFGLFSHTAASNDYVSFESNLPFSFVERPTVTVSGGANGGYIKTVAPYNNTYDLDLVRITYKNGTSDSITSDLHIHVFGFWK